jgi:predicted DNA-binding transcriptional regulator YafY
LKTDLERMVRFLDLIRSNKRIRVERLQREMDLPRSTTYRWLAAASQVLPIRLEEGVVITENSDGDTKSSIIFIGSQ